MRSDVAEVVDNLAPNDALSSDVLLSVDPQLPVDSPSISDPDLDVRVAEKLSSVQDNLLSQFSSVFTDFFKQLESRFIKIEEKSNSLDSSAISVSHSSVLVSQGTINVSQDVSNPSFAASTSVAMLPRHAPDKASYAPRQGGLEIPLGRAAAEDALLSGSSLPRVDLRELEGALQYFDKSGLVVPESFLASRSILVVSVDHGIAIAGSLVADSLASFRSCGVCLEGPDPSQGRDTLLCAL